jgi:hypothetical protein
MNINKGEVFKCSMDLYLGHGMDQKAYMIQKPALNQQIVLTAWLKTSEVDVQSCLLGYTAVIKDDGSSTHL